MRGRRRSMLRGLLVLAIGSMGTPAHGQDNEEFLDDVLGGGRIHATLQATGYYTDNFFNDSRDEEAASGTLVSPRVIFTKETSKLQFQGILDGQYGLFDAPGTVDDYTDVAAQLRLGVQPTLRNRVTLTAGLKHGHDAFGAIRTEDETVKGQDLDRWNEGTGGIHYRGGAPGAKINAELSIKTLQKHYISNRSETQVLNHDATTYQSAFYYNYSPKTSTLLDFNWTDYSFDSSFAGEADTRGGSLYRVRTGIKWLATAKTSGDIRVGYRTRTFNSGESDIAGLDWEAGINWSPAQRDQLEITTARTEQQSYRDDSRVLDVSATTLGWTHSFNARTKTQTRLEYLSVDFEGSARSDEIADAGVTLEYLALSYLWVVANVATTGRDSNIEAREYDRFSGYLGIRLGR